jgi:hypothetical protein
VFHVEQEIQMGTFQVRKITLKIGLNTPSKQYTTRDVTDYSKELHLVAIKVFGIGLELTVTSAYDTYIKDEGPVVENVALISGYLPPVDGAGEIVNWYTEKLMGKFEQNFAWLDIPEQLTLVKFRRVVGSAN